MSRPPLNNANPGWGLVIAIWLGVLGALYLVFDWVIERQNYPNRSIEPNRITGAEELVLKRNRSGHYLTPGSINGQPVTFLLDTGATLVSVPAHLGPTLGLVPGAQGTAQTANGSVTIHLTRIERLSLGPFQLRGVRASLNPGMADDQVLLGMSVLKHLEFTQRGNTLILRPHRS